MTCEGIQTVEIRQASKLQGVAVAILHLEEGGWQPENICSL
jgi:hypothetical protein